MTISVVVNSSIVHNRIVCLFYGCICLNIFLLLLHYTATLLNADPVLRTVLAICPNNNELHIYEGCDNPDPATWRRAHVLKASIFLTFHEISASHLW